MKKGGEKEKQAWLYHIFDFKFHNSSAHIDFSYDEWEYRSWYTENTEDVKLEKNSDLMVKYLHLVIGDIISVFGYSIPTEFVSSLIRYLPWKCLKKIHNWKIHENNVDYLGKYKEGLVSG